MLAHLSPYPPRRPWLYRLGLRRDLSERLILRGADKGTGDLVDEVAGWVAQEDVEAVDPGVV